MLTDFQKRKVTRVFKIYDYDDNNFLEKSDFEQIAQDITSTSGLREGTPKYDNVHKIHLALWEALSAADTDGDGRVSLEEFIASYDQVIASPELYDQMLTPLHNQVFDMYDADDDNTVSNDEFVVFMKSNRLTEDKPGETFARLDVDHKGYLTRDDILRLLHEFYDSNDPNAPGSGFYGKL